MALTDTVGVKTLCNFTARYGDLDRRFTPGPTPAQGIAGHALVRARRGADFEAELALAGVAAGVSVRGRADGYARAAQRLEEVKTYRGSLDAIPENHRALHWAQLKCYGALLCRREGLPRVSLGLVYFDIDRQEETVLEADLTAESLGEFLDDQCARFGAWREQERALRARRDPDFRELAFPHDAMGEGQRQLAEAVYRGTRRGSRLLAQAPTGVGKTLGTLFPAIKALGAGRIDKIFYLAAKGTGRALAMQAARQLSRAGPLGVRVLELVARDKACLRPGSECHGAACPYARGFYDKLPAARVTALACGQMDQAALKRVAEAHEICPYYLSQDLVRWSDVVVGDYNYYFDHGALLLGLAQEHQWRTCVLVDEAHNLVPRARSIFSATLTSQALGAALAVAPSSVRSVLTRLQRAWRHLDGAQEAGYRAFETLPPDVVGALKGVVKAITADAGQLPMQTPPQLLEFQFACLKFGRLFESLAAHSVLEFTRDAAGDSALAIRNVLPGPLLQDAYRAAHCLTLFSATLQPEGYYRDVLGLREETAWLDVRSPFCPTQLDVHVVAHLSTRFGHRQRSLPDVAAYVAARYREEPGNYLLFASSFDYLAQLRAELCREHPDIALHCQEPAMTEAQRAAFLERFSGDGAVLGLAVLGGAFAEGIDLPGRRLIGAFILTLGLSQRTASLDETQRRLEALVGNGYEYTYLYPALQRVVQAAGRVIRGVADRGRLYLIDDRYSARRIQTQLPRWWRIPAAAVAHGDGASRPAGDVGQSARERASSR